MQKKSCIPLIVEIENLTAKFEIEIICTEIYNLKMLAQQK